METLHELRNQYTENRDVKHLQIVEFTKTPDFKLPRLIIKKSKIVLKCKIIRHHSESISLCRTSVLVNPFQ